MCCAAVAVYEETRCGEMEVASFCVYVVFRGQCHEACNCFVVVFVTPLCSVVTGSGSGFRLNYR